ncbi:MAG: hypothetical protein AAF927_02000 [Bacteroidota bacterium]
MLKQLGQFCEHPYWRLYSIVIAFLLSIMFAFPAYDSMLPGAQKVKNHQHLEEQFEYPLQNPDASPETHQAKMVFRLTVPALANISGVRNPKVYILLQHLLGLGFFYFFLLLAERLFEDKVSALLLLLSIVAIYLGKSFFWDIQGWFDGLAFFFLLLSMYTKSPPVQWLCLSIAFWTDERAILASGLIWCWWKIQYYETEKLSFKKLIWPDRITLTFVIAWGAYLALRFWLGHTYGMQTPMGDSGAFGFQRWEVIVPALFTALEGTWLLFVPLLLGIKINRSYWLLAAIALGFLAVVIPALTVADMTRSLTYCFPIFLIAAYFLKDQVDIQDGQTYLLIIAIICWLFPNFTVISVLSWMHPIFPGIFVDHQHM